MNNRKWKKSDSVKYERLKSLHKKYKKVCSTYTHMRELYHNCAPCGEGTGWIGGVKLNPKRKYGVIIGVIESLNVIAMVKHMQKPQNKPIFDKIMYVSCMCCFSVCYV